MSKCEHTEEHRLLIAHGGNGTKGEYLCLVGGCWGDVTPPGKRVRGERPRTPKPAKEEDEACGKFQDAEGK